MSETINDRIEMLINDRFDGNKAAFAKSIGLPPTGLSNYLGKQRRSKPSVDMVTKIITTLGVDATWLLTGVKSNIGDHFEQHGDHALMAKNIQHLEIDQRNIGEERQTEIKKVDEEIILPPNCPDEVKRALMILTSEVSYLNRLIAEKDIRIEEKNEVIAELRERIKELKSR